MFSASRFVPRCCLLVAVVFVAASCGVPSSRTGWKEPKAHPFVTGPYILFGGPDKAYVALKADLAKPPVVQWWVDDNEAPGVVPADAKSATAVQEKDVWVATLDGLPPVKYVHYRVVSSRHTTKVETFRVGVGRDEPFRFAAFGDTRTGHAVHRAVVEGLARERIEFVVHTGDMVDRGGKKHQWERFFQIERPLLKGTPIIPAIGNHDVGRDYFGRYFLLDRWTNNRRYYYHDWGNLRIVIMDGGIECRKGCEQYAFVRRALKEGAAKGMLMVMALHWPPYSSGAHGSQKLVQKPISELADLYGVELVIAGHDHNYERTKVLKGTTYVVSGSAGAPIRPVRPRSFTAVARTEPHYVLFDVENGRIIMRAINTRGDTFDTFTIKPNPPAEQREKAAAK